MMSARVILCSLLISASVHATDPRFDSNSLAKPSASVIQKYLLPQEGIVFDDPHTAKLYVHGPSFLRIENHNISGEIHHYNFVHPNVRMLCIDYCGILTHKDVSFLSEFKHLEYLKLCGTEISESLLIDLIRGLPETLYSLELDETGMSDGVLQTLGNAINLLNLRRLWIWNDGETNLFSEDALTAFSFSPVALGLQRVYLGLIPEISFNLPLRTLLFYRKLTLKYSDFYETDPRSDEIYMLEDPMDHSFIWDYDVRQKSFELRFMGQVVSAQARFHQEVIRRLRAAAARGEVVIENTESPVRGLSPNVDQKINEFLQMVKGSQSSSGTQSVDDELIKKAIEDVPGSL